MRVGVVSQDVFLFNDTIRANITYAVPNATQEEIEEAAIQAMPMILSRDYQKDMTA